MAWLEDQLPTGVYVTRAVRNVRAKVALTKSIDELYEESLQYAEFARRLYGPQEDELSEQEISPLLFAEAVDNKKRTIAEMINSISKYSHNQLASHLTSRGYCSSGTRPELEGRLRRVLETEVL